MNKNRYLFRGFHKDENGKETIYLNGEEVIGNWVYGSLISNVNKTNRYFIVEDVVYTYTNDNEIINQIIDDKVEVIPDTISQYTGLDDKNGKKIFENDVVHICYGKRENIYQIIFDKQELDFKATNSKENYEDNFQYLDCCDEVEVIRTIFDEKEVK